MLSTVSLPLIPAFICFQRAISMLIPCTYQQTALLPQCKIKSLIINKKLSVTIWIRRFDSTSSPAISESHLTRWFKRWSGLPVWWLMWMPQQSYCLSRRPSWPSILKWFNSVNKTKLSQRKFMLQNTKSSAMLKGRPFSKRRKKLKLG